MHLRIGGGGGGGGVKSCVCPYVGFAAAVAVCADKAGIAAAEI